MRHFTRDKSLTSSSPPMCAAIYGQHHSGGFLAYRQSKDFFRGFCCLPRFRSCPNPFPLRPFQAVFLVCSFLSPTAPTRQGHCYAVPLRIRFRKKFCLAAAVSAAFPPAKGRVKKRQGFLSLIDQPARNMRQDRSIWRLTVIEPRAFPLLRKKAPQAIAACGDVACPTRFERAAYRVGVCRSIQLGYGHTLKLL